MERRDACARIFHALLQTELREPHAYYYDLAHQLYSTNDLGGEVVT